MHIWRTVSLAALAFAAHSFGVNAQSFENTAVVRTVELGGSLVHVTTTYAIKSLESGPTIYTVSISPEEKLKTSWLEAKLKGKQDVLLVQDRGYHPDSGLYLLDIELPESLKLNATINLVLETVQTHVTRPWPESAGQQDEQALKFDTNLLVLSPYHTAVQRTKLRSPTSRVLSHTTPENMDLFTLEDPVTKSGSTITYGPYNNVPPSANADFVDKHQKQITVHYNYDHPVLEVTMLKRSAEISHWGANLNIEDEIHLHNGGPLLKGHFSRIEHQTQAFYKRASPHVLPSLTLHLPAGIKNTYYYDLIGNVSTSHLRTAPLTSSLSKQYSVLEMKPRYPLMGGWNYSFTLGWDSPLADSVKWDRGSGRYIAEIPIMTLIPGAVVDNAEVKIILPEGASDVSFVTPFPAIANSISTHTTYLDTTGRPALTFTYSQLTDRHSGVIYVSYTVPLSAHLKKPLAVATAFFALFTLSLGVRRIDLRIHKKTL